MRIQCATYNGHLGQGQSVLPPTDGREETELASWLSTTLAHPDGTAGPPDLVAVGFQEMIPLHLALAGFTSTALDLHQDKLKRAIEQTHSRSPRRDDKGETRETYSLVARKALGGIALLVYSNDRTLTSQLDRVEIATAACGIVNMMGNKGAVGIRVNMKQGESWTFVTAHLAAHQNQVERRNRDWKEIVQRLVFVDEANGNEHNLYETGHLFVFGDLNYRISLTTPRKLAPHLLSHHISNLTSSLSDESSLTSSLATLLPHDQLQQQSRQHKTLHHLAEAPITFAPTYKFKPGTRDTYKDFKKRIPGWCDRILYAVPTTAEVQVEMYRSEMDFTASDHKPVTAMFNIASKSKSHERLNVTSPYRISPTWRRSQQIGQALDRLVGIIWCLIVFAGFGKDARWGIINLTGAAVGTLVWKGGWKLLA
ncbi:phosphoinositide 5-phosphatase INP54 [Sporobolomyces koalae]|uniref:phosphoinositide 5-phosphatase INP54 n=1 Tax=Sporobolomyces koalae TaxID=500713 RepID=UPI00317E66A0